jgi:serine/threonine protein kinase
MLEAVQFIHRQRIIHADIKPDNFILGRDSPIVKNYS